MQKRTGRDLRWDDLRVFDAVARHGSLSAAGRELAVTHSTVYRRLQALEEDLGVRLFDRFSGRYELTPAGERMLRTTAQVGESVAVLDRDLRGRDLQLSGELRITTTDTLALGLLPPYLADFRRAYPEIVLEVVSSNEFLSLSRRQADVAVRPADRPPQHLYGRRVARLGWAPWAARGYLKDRGRDPDAWEWVAPDESLRHLPAAEWLARSIEPARIALRTNSIMTALAAIRAGLGVGLLPSFLAAGDDGLERLAEPAVEVASDLWVLTHPDLRTTARVRAVLEFLGERLRADRSRLEP